MLDFSAGCSDMRSSLWGGVHRADWSGLQLADIRSYYANSSRFLLLPVMSSANDIWTRDPSASGLLIRGARPLLISIFGSPLVFCIHITLHHRNHILLKELTGGWLGGWVATCLFNWYIIPPPSPPPSQPRWCCIGKSYLSKIVSWAMGRSLL